MIHRTKQKGFNFNDFIKEAASSILHQERIAVNKALLEGAVSDSHQDRKLYYQLMGDLKETNLNTGVTLNKKRTTIFYSLIYSPVVLVTSGAEGGI